MTNFRIVFEHPWLLLLLIPAVVLTMLPYFRMNKRYRKTRNRISSIVFGIPAVKGIAFGNGFDAAELKGSENNDAYYMDGDTVRTKTNRHGGILCGISTGMPLTFKVAIKPTPSIAKEQETVELSSKSAYMLAIKGRHDPCIVPRAVPCVEAALAIALADFLV